MDARIWRRGRIGWQPVVGEGRWLSLERIARSRESGAREGFGRRLGGSGSCRFVRDLPKRVLSLLVRASGSIFQRVKTPRCILF